MTIQADNAEQTPGQSPGTQAGLIGKEPSSRERDDSERSSLAGEVARRTARGLAFAALCSVFVFVLVKRPAGGPFWDGLLFWRAAGAALCAAYPVGVFSKGFAEMNLVDGRRGFLAACLAGLAGLPFLLFWGLDAFNAGTACLPLALFGMAAFSLRGSLGLVRGDIEAKDISTRGERSLDEESVRQVLAYAFLNMAWVAAFLACFWLAQAVFDHNVARGGLCEDTGTRCLRSISLPP